MPTHVSLWPFLWWCRLQPHKFSIETIENDLKMNKLPRRTKVYDCMYFKLFGVRWLPLTETYSFNSEMEVWKIPYSFHSIIWQPRITQPKFLGQFIDLKKKKKKSLSYISSFKLYISSKHAFIAVSNFVPKKINNLKLYTSCSILPTPPRSKSNSSPQEGLTGQIPHCTDKESSKMPEVDRGWGDVEVSISHWLKFVSGLTRCNSSRILRTSFRFDWLGFGYC